MGSHAEQGKIETNSDTLYLNNPANTKNERLISNKLSNRSLF